MGNVGDVGNLAPPDANASVEELRKQGLSDDQIAQIKGVPVEQVKLNDQLPNVTNIPAQTGQARSPVLQAIDANPSLASLDEATKQSIANNPNSPLNPLNPNFTLGNKDEFGREAQTEQILQQAQAQQQANQIAQFGQQYQTQAEAARQQLANRLSGQANELQSQYQTGLGDYANALAGSRQKTFEQANPFILEDLNRRGLFNSPTAVAQAQAQKLAELQSGDEAKLGEASLGALNDVQNFRQQGDTSLNQFDQGVFGQGQDIASSGLNALIGGNQDALSSALDLRRQGIENQLGLAQAAADRSFAASQAAKQRKSALLGSTIGAVGGIGSAVAGKKH